MTALFLNGAWLIDNPDLIMFDKDGTLIDIHHYWGSMIKLRAERIIKRYFSNHSMAIEIRNRIVNAMGVDLNSGNLKPEGPVGVMPRSYIIQIVMQVSKSWGLALVEDQVEEIFLEIDQETSTNMQPLLKLLPGVERLLQDLNKHKIPIALVSTDITSRAVAAMRALGVESYFDVILGGDAVIKTKPSPDLALRAISYCSANALNSLVIGDHRVDIEMGRAAGCRINIGVLNGISSLESFSNSECILIPDLTHISVQ